jgi:hypothetical protein
MARLGRLRPLDLVRIAIAWGIGPAWSAPASMQRMDTANITVERPTVAVFLPPSLQSATDAQAQQVRQLVRSALQSTKRCLGAGFASYQLVFAQRIVLRSSDRRESFDVGDYAPLVGVLLAQPGANVRMLVSGGGPEALDRMLPWAASTYFGRTCRG